MKNLILSILLIVSGPALANAWDSPANIDKATERAVTAYKAGGIDAVIAESRNCYAGVNATPKNKNAGRDVEHCVAIEIAGALIDNGQTPYLRLSEIVIRAMYHLETAGLRLTQPEVPQYFSRFSGIKGKLPAML